MQVLKFKKSVFSIILFSLVSAQIFSDGALEPMKIDKTKSKTENSINLFYKNDSWGFVGKKFYDDPKKTYDKFYKKFIRGTMMVLALASGAASCGYAGYKTGCFLENRYNLFANTNMSEGCAFVGGVSGAFIGFVSLYKSCSIFMRKKADQEALKNFLINWEEYKKLTPQSLHEVFDTFCVEFLQNGWESIVPHTCDIIKEVRKQLASNDRRYTALYETEKEFFDLTYLSFDVRLDIVRLLELIWDIFRARS